MMTYFYTSVVFNPVDQADNLRKYNGYIPGIRPGPADGGLLRPRAQPAHVPGRAVPRGRRRGAVDLHRALPLLAGDVYRALGGTSVLIVVGVALQTMRQMESQMVMRHYEGFLR